MHNNFYEVKHFVVGCLVLQLLILCRAVFVACFQLEELYRHDIICMSNYAM